MAMAIQNGGLALGPYLAGVLIDNKSYKDSEGKKIETNESYLDVSLNLAQVSYMMIAAAGLSILVGMMIWIQDCRTGSKLSKIDQKQALSKMLASPTPEERQEILDDSNIEPNIKQYLVSPRSKNSLRRSFYGGNAKWLINSNIYQIINILVTVIQSSLASELNRPWRFSGPFYLLQHVYQITLSKLFGYSPRLAHLNYHHL